jgi:putative transposase
MQRLNGLYAQGFNRRHGATGHVFESRYGARLVERDAHARELARYLALNPVRAGASARPEDWRWSSYRAVLGVAPAPPFLAAGWLLEYFGMTRERARERLRAFVEDGLRACADGATRPTRAGLAPGA